MLAIGISYHYIFLYVWYVSALKCDIALVLGMNERNVCTFYVVI